MKTIKLIAVIILLLSAAGCATVVMEDGVIITGTKIHTTTFHNKSDHLVVIMRESRNHRSILVRTFKLIQPGKDDSFDDPSNLKVKYTMLAEGYDPNRPIGVVLKESDFYYPSLIDREIDITNLTVLGLTEHVGYFVHSGDPARINLDDGRSFDIYDGQVIMFRSVSGMLHFTMQPLRDPFHRYGPEDHHFLIDHEHGDAPYYPPNGGPVQLKDFRIPTRAYWN